MTDLQNKQKMIFRTYSCDRVNKHWHHNIALSIFQTEAQERIILPVNNISPEK